MSYGIMLTRAVYYTAITRAKTKLVLVGDQAALKRAIDNKRRGVRKSLLGPRIITKTKKYTASNASQETAMPVQQLMGAAVDMLKSPRAILAVIAVFLVLIILPVTFVGVFLIEFPGAIINSITAAVKTAYDDLVVGWESLKIKVSNGIDDFLTWLTTGDTGDASSGFATDVAAAQDPDFASYIGTSNALVGVRHHRRRGRKRPV